MMDNEILKKRVLKDLKRLHLNSEQEDRMVKELNYLSNLLVEVYVRKTEEKYE